jgi:hypothetical protein
VSVEACLADAEAAATHDHAQYLICTLICVFQLAAHKASHRATLLASTEAAAPGAADLEQDLAQLLTAVLISLEDKQAQRHLDAFVREGHVGRLLPLPVAVPPFLTLESAPDAEGLVHSQQCHHLQCALLNTFHANGGLLSCATVGAARTLTCAAARQCASPVCRASAPPGP